MTYGFHRMAPNPRGSFSLSRRCPIPRYNIETWSPGTLLGMVPEMLSFPSTRIDRSCSGNDRLIKGRGKAGFIISSYCFYSATCYLEKVV